MTNEERAKALREELRNGRNSAISATSEDSRGYNRSADAEVGAGNQDVSGRKGSSNTRARSRSKGKGNDSGFEQGFDSITQRLRLPNRRFVDDNSSIDTVEGNTGESDGNRGTRRLVRTDAIKERIETEIPQSTESFRPRRGRPPKESSNPQEIAISTVPVEPIREQRKKPRENLFPWFKSGKVLSTQEINNLEEPLKQAVRDYSNYVDTYLTFKTHVQQTVWSSMEDWEVEAVVNFLLKRGRTNEMAAATVRNMVDSNEYLGLGFILAPRTLKTVQLTSQVRKEKQDAIKARGQDVRAK